MWRCTALSKPSLLPSFLPRPHHRPLPPRACAFPAPLEITAADGCTRAVIFLITIIIFIHLFAYSLFHIARGLDVELRLTLFWLPVLRIMAYSMAELFVTTSVPRCLVGKGLRACCFATKILSGFRLGPGSFSLLLIKSSCSVTC